jgi:hypothetical protein
MTETQDSGQEQVNTPIDDPRFNVWQKLMTTNAGAKIADDFEKGIKSFLTDIVKVGEEGYQFVFDSFYAPTLDEIRKTKMGSRLSELFYQFTRQTENQFNLALGYSEAQRLGVGAAIDQLTDAQSRSAYVGGLGRQVTSPWRNQFGLEANVGGGEA